jgi:MarR family transcriptional regulator for hemolysin
MAKLNPNLRLTVQMVLIARRWRSLLDERLRPLGHSSARMEAMSTIAYAPPFSQQIELAKRLGVEGATFTRMLDSLEAAGLVERLADPSDRRANRIRLTKTGEAALAEITTLAERLRAHLLEGIAPPAIDGANAFMAKLLARLDEDFPATDGIGQQSND